MTKSHKSALTFVLLLITVFIHGHAFSQNVIGSTGKVGIGTTSPSSLLDVYFGPLPVPASPFSPVGIQSRAYSANSTSYWSGNVFSAEQPVGKVGNFACLGLTTTTSNPSGNVETATTLALSHNHTGAGTVGEVHVVDGRFIVYPGDGNVTTATMYYGDFLVPNGAAQTNTIQNAYGLYIDNFPTNVTNRYGVYIVDPAAGNYLAGQLSIGTTTVPSGYRLAVNGMAIFTKVVVKTYPWSDYVFKKDYHLPSLDSVARYVRQYNHLSDIPSAQEVEKSGVDVGANQALLLKKVEELTLYLIQQNEKLKVQEKEIAKLKKKVAQQSAAHRN